MTSPAARKGRYPALDGLRGLAALAIVATHAGFASGRSGGHDLLAVMLGRADIGLAVFFLLSGFLLYQPYALAAAGRAPAPSDLRFWWRRALRIFPALWLAVVVVLGVITTGRRTANDWIQYLLLTHIYDHHEVDPNLTQLWTLSAEIAFYAMIPLLGRAASFRSRRPFERQLAIVGALIGASLVFDVVQNRYLTHQQAQLWIPAYLDWFAWGILLAVLSTGEPSMRWARGIRDALYRWAADPVTCFVIAGVGWGLTLTQLGTPRGVVLASFAQWTFQHYAYGLVGLFLMLPLVLGRAVGADQVLGSRLGRYLGNISYGVYLWHLALLLLIQRELGYEPFTGHFWLLLGLTTLASLAAASASWYLLERPILRHGTRGWRRGALSGGAPSAKQTAARARS